MKYTQVAADAFQKFQMNAGVLLDEFDPTDPPATTEEIASMREHIILASSGGVSFTVTPEFVDFGDDVDNVPANTMEMKVLQSVTAVMSGTAKTMDNALAKRLMAAATVDSSTGKITPKADVTAGDFADLWWVGDYSDVNTGEDAGFMAIRLINALSTGGFSLQPNDKAKGDFAFEFTGHYSLADMSVLPYEVYIVEGTHPDTTLASLTIANVTLSPTFNKDTHTYTGSTTSESSTVTATATDSTDATVAIKVNGTAVTSGNSATWVSGSNTVLVTVTNGGESSTYTVTVTKSAS